MRPAGDEIAPPAPGIPARWGRSGTRRRLALAAAALAIAGGPPSALTLLAARGDGPAALGHAPSVRPLAAREAGALITPAAVRAAPGPDAPVVAKLPMGAAVEADARTADAAFLRVAGAGAAGERVAGWIWAPLAKRELPPPDPDVAHAAAAAAAARDPAPPALSAGEWARQLKRYRVRFHAALRRFGIDPLGNDVAAAVGMFRDIVGRVRAEHVRPVDLSGLVDHAIRGLEGEADQPASPRPVSPHALMLASLRPALAALEGGASTIMTRAELAAEQAPIEDQTRGQDDDGGGEEAGWPEEGAGGRTLFLEATGFPVGTAAAVEGFITRELARAGRPIAVFVLDLRGNGGGTLEEAVAFADLFLPAGEIGRTVRRRPDRTEYHMGVPGELLEGVPMVVLVDEGTAAGAELVAGALQSAGRALIVGRATQGWAWVHTIMPLAGGHGALRLTTGRLTLADGREFACRGLAPEVRLGSPARPAAVADGLGRTGCGAAPPLPVAQDLGEACPVPGGDGIRGDLACVAHALRAYVLAAPAGR